MPKYGTLLVRAKRTAFTPEARDQPKPASRRSETEQEVEDDARQTVDVVELCFTHHYRAMDMRNAVYTTPVVSNGTLYITNRRMLFAIAEGPRKVRLAVRLRPAIIALLGLSLAIIAGLPAVLASQPFLTGIWWNLGSKISVGTPLLFDTGVFLAVLGAILAILLTLEES